MNAKWYQQMFVRENLIGQGSADIYMQNEPCPIELN